jgi:hypothetical protein
MSADLALVAMLPRLKQVDAVPRSKGYEFEVRLQSLRPNLAIWAFDVAEQW